MLGQYQGRQVSEELGQWQCQWQLPFPFAWQLQIEALLHVCGFAAGGPFGGRCGDGQGEAWQEVGHGFVIE